MERQNIKKKKNKLEEKHKDARWPSRVRRTVDGGVEGREGAGCVGVFRCGGAGQFWYFKMFYILVNFTCYYEFLASFECFC